MSSGHDVQLVQTILESIRPAIALFPVIPEATTTEDTNDTVKFTKHSIILRSLYRLLMRMIKIVTRKTHLSTVLKIYQEFYQNYQITPHSKAPPKTLSLPLFNTQSSPPVSPFLLTPTIPGSLTSPVFFLPILSTVPQVHEALEPPT